MVPGSLPNPISFDHYYYSCFLRDGAQESIHDVLPSEKGGDTQDETIKISEFKRNSEYSSELALAELLPGNAGFFPGFQSGARALYRFVIDCLRHTLIRVPRHTPSLEG